VSADLIHLHAVHTIRPEINGVSFDDINAVTVTLRQALCDRDLVFITSFQRNGSTYGGSIIATSYEHAEAIAKTRGLGETIDGQLVEAVNG
jgi:hypothetical protein